MTKKAKNWLLVLAIVLIAAVAFAALHQVNGLIANRKVTQFEYKIGIVSTETGKVADSNQNIYLKDLYKVDGAEITLEEDASVSVKVFYYDEDKAFIEAQTDLDMETNAPSDAVYFRIMITPALVDGEPADVTLLNMRHYTNQVRIVVAK